MNVNQIELKKAGILFFDMLNAYFQNLDETAKAQKKPMVDNAVRLMKAGREAGIPIFFAQGGNRADSSLSYQPLTDTNHRLQPWPGGVVTRGKSHIIEGTPSSQVIPELNPQPNDYFVPKYRWSAFHQTYLDLALRARGIDTLIISGGSTDVGIAATVFGGKDMDYNMIIVRDACATNNDPRTHDVLMDLVFPRMARIRNTDQVLRMIHEASGTK